MYFINLRVKSHKHSKKRNIVIFRYVAVGGFSWDLIFNWHQIPEREKKRREHFSAPIRSPTMAGGLFAINKAFFEKLGTYDSGKYFLV